MIERFQHFGEQTTESPEWNSDRKRSSNVWVGGGVPWNEGRVVGMLND